MSMQEKVFDRVEKKYLITSEQKAKLLEPISHYMHPDKYHKSEVYNIYFDNDNYDLIVQSIDHPVFKEKLRARSYAGYDRVFLEIKTKIKGKEYNVGYKRRVMITRDDFSEFVKKRVTLFELAKRSPETKNDLQIAQEVDYLIEHFDLKPKILVRYHRKSYKDDDGLRVTFDEDLKYRDRKLRFVKEKRDKIYFKDNYNIIMEIKAHGTIPLWLVRNMSELKIFPQRFSKIGKIYERIRKEKNV